MPFEGLVPATTASHAAWVVDAMAGMEGVAFVVPEGFDAYARLLHPLENGRLWVSVAADYLHDGKEPYRSPFPEPVTDVEGNMGPILLDALVPALASWTTTPQLCHYALWTGWAELHPGSHSVFTFSSHRIGTVSGLQDEREVRSLEHTWREQVTALHAFVPACPVQAWWGGRNMLLFDGTVEAAVTIGSPWGPEGGLRRRGPQWWWPDDRRWFVATEIDYPWTYVAGPTGLITAVIEDVRVEAVRVKPTDLW